MKQDWYIQKYRNGDEDEIIRLLNNVYGTWNDKSYWNWKYLENPIISENIIMIAKDEDKLVGHHGLITVKMKIGNDYILGSQAVDLAVDPSYRRKGIFKTLAVSAYKEAIKNKIFFTYAFPLAYKRKITETRGASHKGSEKMGWVNICNMLEMCKYLNLKSILKRYVHNKHFLEFFSIILNNFFKIFFNKEKKLIDNELKIIKVSKFDDRVNNLFKEISKEYSVIVMRTKDYLNWRYANKFKTEYIIYLAEKQNKILGYIILKCKCDEQSKNGYIVDFLVPSTQNNVALALLKKAIMYFKEKDMDKICFTLPPKSRFYKIFKKNGFFTHKTDLILIARTNNSSVLPISSFKDFKKWFITKGDSDLI